MTGIPLCMQGPALVAHLANAVRRTVSLGQFYVVIDDHVGLFGTIDRPLRSTRRREGGWQAVET